MIAVRRVAVLLAAVLGLSACGSDAAPTPGASPSSAGSSSSASSAETSGSGASGGSEIKADVTALPQTVGEWSKSDGSGPGGIYDRDGRTVIVGWVGGVDFEELATNIAEVGAGAVAGVCGPASPDSTLTCVLRAADGVYTVAVDTGETSVTELAAFADELTAALGTT